MISTRYKKRAFFVFAATVFLILFFVQQLGGPETSSPIEPADLRLEHGRWHAVRQHAPQEGEVSKLKRKLNDGTAESADARARGAAQEREREESPAPRPRPGPVPLILHQQTRSELELPLELSDCVRGVLLAHPIWHPSASWPRVHVHLQPEVAGARDRNRTSRSGSRTGKHTTLKVPCESRIEEANDSFAYWLWSEQSTAAYVQDGWEQPDADQTKIYFAAFRSLRSDTQNVHLLRYLVMYEFGGVFIDMDLQPSRQSIIRLLNRGFPCTLLEEGGLKTESRVGKTVGLPVDAAPRVSNSVLLCRPRHPFFKHVLDSLARLLGAIPRAHETEVDEQFNNEPLDTWKVRQKAANLAPFTEEEQIKRALRQGHGTGSHFLSWALERYLSAHPELSARCLGDAGASPDCVYVARCSPTPTGLSFARCMSKSSASGSGKGKRKAAAPPLPQGMASVSGEVQIQHAADRHGGEEKGEAANMGIGPSYPLSSLLAGYCTYVHNNGVYYMPSIQI